MAEGCQKRGKSPKSLADSRFPSTPSRSSRSLLGLLTALKEGPIQSSVVVRTSPAIVAPAEEEPIDFLAIGPFAAKLRHSRSQPELPDVLQPAKAQQKPKQAARSGGKRGENCDPQVQKLEVKKSQILKSKPEAAKPSKPQKAKGSQSQALVAKLRRKVEGCSQENTLQLVSAVESASTMTKIVAAAEFASTTSTSSRPQRARFPVLQHWRNERLVFERQKGSDAPTVAAVVVAPTPATTPEKATSSRRGPRQRSLLALKDIEAEKTAAVRDPCPHCGNSAGSRRPAVVPELPEVTSSSSTVTPLRSALRRPREEDAEAEPSKRRKSVSFNDEPNSSPIENFSHLSQYLWHDGSFMVDCDICDARVQFGAEGNCGGALHRSRFAQWQVTCNSCLSERLYAEAGAWLVVALASRATAADGDEDHELKAIAEVPVAKLVDALSRLRPGRRPDKLVDILGQEAADADARSELLSKAMTQVSSLLGASTATEGTALPSSSRAVASHSHGAVEPEVATQSAGVISVSP